MEDEAIQHYVRDLVHMLRESAREARTACGHGAGADAFDCGRALAYAEVLTRMQTLADAFMLPRAALGLDGFDPVQDLACAGRRPVP